MKIHYVTSNPGNFAEAKHLLQGHELVHTPLDLEEIQGTSEQIALHKIQEAHNKLKSPCLIDDISVSCPAIGGLPGPYIRAFLEAIGDAGLAEMLSHYADKSCEVLCHIAFMDSKPLLFEGRVLAEIVSPRGSRMAHTHSWNAIVKPVGLDKTFAEMSLEEASKLSARAKALTQFRNHLLAQ